MKTLYILKQGIADQAREGQPNARGKGGGRMSLKKLPLLAISVLVIVGLVLTGGCLGQEAATRTIEDVTPQEAFTLIQDNQNNPDFVIIDVRTPEEFAEEHIENSTNLDFYDKTFRKDLNKLDKEKTYLIYCRSGGRSGNALEIMDELDFREVYNVSGGIIAWKEAGLPTAK